MSTRLPARVAAVAMAAVTVVLPTPPLPATIKTREAEQNCSRSMAEDATGVPLAPVLRRVAAVVALAAGVACLACGSAARAASSADRGGIDVVTVSGYLDPPNQSLVLDSVKQANARGSTMLVIQLTSTGAI